MVGYRIPLGRAHQITSAGAPLSGAKLYVYSNGTTTPVSLFSDYLGTVSAANPVVADDTGRFAFRYVNATSRVTLVLKTSADVTVWSDDNIAPEFGDLANILLAANNLSDLASVIAALDNIHTKGSDIVAAGTTDLSTATGLFVDITGGTTINAFGTEAAGVLRLLRFTASGTITHNATSLICPGSANITRANGDMALVVSLGSGNWQIALYMPISGGVVLNSAVKPTECWLIAVSDETTSITTGAAKVTFRAPYAFTLTDVRASLTGTSSGSGPVTVDINENGTTILSTKLTIDDGEKTSTTAATPVVISDTSIADDAEITIDIDDEGTSAEGLKVYMIGRRT